MIFSVYKKRNKAYSYQKSLRKLLELHLKNFDGSAADKIQPYYN